MIKSKPNNTNNIYIKNRNKEKCPLEKNDQKEKNERQYFIPEKSDECFITRITDFDSCYYSIKMIIIFYILSRIINWFNDKFIVWIILNVLIFYGPIEKKYPYFLFKCRVSVEQIFQGIIGLVGCLIPKYEEDNKENKI